MAMSLAILAPSGASADGVSNSFVTIEGGGLVADGNGGVIRTGQASGPVTVAARSGWLVNGRESVTFQDAGGLSGGLKFTSKLGEDHACMPPPPTSNDTHCAGIEIAAEANPPRIIAMYAAPASNATVSASADSTVISAGRHEAKMTWEEWECNVCGAKQEARTNVTSYEVVPDAYDWTASAAGLALKASTWSGPMTNGVGQAIKFSVTARSGVCPKCEGSTIAEAEADVYRLSIKRPDYLGIDMTDAMRGVKVTRTARANIEPAPAGAEYEWTRCGVCEFVGATDEQRVVYGATDETKASGAYLAERLTVRATAKNAAGMSVASTCTTNFTVVRVEVKIGAVGEDVEESKGAFLCVDAPVKVTFDVSPGNLPGDADNFVVACNDLYRKVDSSDYDVCIGEGNDKAFFKKFDAGKGVARDQLSDVYIICRESSKELRSGTIRFSHPLSGAVDVSRYTAVALDFEVKSDKLMPYDDVDGGRLIDNRKATITVSATPEGLVDLSDMGISFVASTVEKDNLVNRDMKFDVAIERRGGNQWGTHDVVYWYGIKPDREHYSDKWGYEFTLLLNGTPVKAKKYLVCWPENRYWADEMEIPENLSAPGEPKQYGGYWYCEIKFVEFVKNRGYIESDPSEKTSLFNCTSQYKVEIEREENYHLKQQVGEVSRKEGGLDDCYTVKGIKYFIAEQAKGDANIVTTTWIVKESTSARALRKARNVISKAVEMEINESERIANDINTRALMELKAKEHAGYNAAWRYHHCTYRNLPANPKRPVHKAYKED